MFVLTSFQYLHKNVIPICESNESLKLLNDVLLWKNLPENQRFGILSEQQTMKRTSSSKLMVIGGNSDCLNLTIETYCSQTDTWTMSSEKIQRWNGVSRYTLIGENLYIAKDKVRSSNLILLSHFQISNLLYVFHTI